MIKKVLVAGGATSTFVTIGIGAFWYFKNSSVKDTSIDELFSKLSGKIKLTKEDKYVNEWGKRWGKYIDANTENGKLKDKDIWGLEDWTTAKRHRSKIPKSFADKCENQLSAKVKDDKDPNFLNYVEWCTK